MSNKIFICNDCNRKHYTNEEPDRCDCGADDFGIHEDVWYIKLRENRCPHRSLKDNIHACGLRRQERCERIQCPLRTLEKFEEE